MLTEGVNENKSYTLVLKKKKCIEFIVQKLKMKFNKKSGTEGFPIGLSHKY